MLLLSNVGITDVCCAVQCCVVVCCDVLSCASRYPGISGTNFSCMLSNAMIYFVLQRHTRPLKSTLLATF